MKEVFYKDTRIIAGNDVKDNAKLLDDYNHTDFIFVHLKSYPSSHVVVKHNNPDEEILMFAANLCKTFSKYKYLKGLKAIYTPYNNVKKTNIPGAVLFKSKRKVNDLKITTPEYIEE